MTNTENRGAEEGDRLKDMDIDFFKAKATTILECGTTNADYYVIVQQGASHSVEIDRYAEGNVFKAMTEFAPKPPSKEFVLYKIEMRDYKTATYAEYYFSATGKKYSEEIKITEVQKNNIYNLFRKCI